MHEQIHCHNEAANHQFPIAVAIFITMHLSNVEECWGSTPYLLFGLERCAYDGQYLPNQKAQWAWSSSCGDFAMPSLGVENQATSIGMTGPSFPDYSHRPWIYLRYDLLEDIWFIGCNLNQVISNCSMMFLLLWWQKSWNEFCHDTFHVKILCQNLRHSSFWNLQISF